MGQDLKFGFNLRNVHNVHAPAAIGLFFFKKKGDNLRGRPLMIWGGRGKIENEFIFSAGIPFEVCFFPGEGLFKFIFSWRRPFEILFFFPRRTFEIV